MSIRKYLNNSASPKFEIDKSLLSKLNKLTNKSTKTCQNNQLQNQYKKHKKIQKSLLQQLNNIRQQYINSQKKIISSTENLIQVIRQYQIYYQKQLDKVKQEQLDSIQNHIENFLIQGRKLKKIIKKGTDGELFHMIYSGDNALQKIQEASRKLKEYDHTIDQFVGIINKANTLIQDKDKQIIFAVKKQSECQTQQVIFKNSVLQQKKQKIDITKLNSSELNPQQLVNSKKQSNKLINNEELNIKENSNIMNFELEDNDFFQKKSIQESQKIRKVYLQQKECSKLNQQKSQQGQISYLSQRSNHALKSVKSAQDLLGSKIYISPRSKIKYIEQLNRQKQKFDQIRSSIIS